MHLSNPEIYNTIALFKTPEEMIKQAGRLLYHNTTDYDKKTPVINAQQTEVCMGGASFSTLKFHRVM